MIGLFEMIMSCTDFHTGKCNTLMWVESMLHWYQFQWRSTRRADISIDIEPRHAVLLVSIEFKCDTDIWGTLDYYIIHIPQSLWLKPLWIMVMQLIYSKSSFRDTKHKKGIILRLCLVCKLDLSILGRRR